MLPRCRVVAGARVPENWAQKCLRWFRRGCAGFVFWLPMLTADAAQVTLSWSDNSDNETGFRIERASGAGEYDLLAVIGANETTYVDTDVVGGESYSYRVQAFNDAGVSAFSNATLVTLAAIVGNLAPTITDILHQTLGLGLSTGLLTFTIGDAELSASDLTITVESSNQTVVPVGNVIVAGIGAMRTVVVTPALLQSGSSTISVTVSDGELSAMTSFVVNFGLGISNTQPSISQISNRTISEDGTTGTIAFIVGDSETAVSSLNVTASSSNTAVVPNGNIVLGGTGADRTVSVTPAREAAGSSTITLRVSDGSLVAVETFVVSVSAVNDRPTISDVANQSVAMTSSTNEIAFTIADTDTSVGNLSLSATSSDTTLVPASAVVFGGSGTSRTVRVTPVAGRTGSSTITVRVSDGVSSASDAFTVAVTTVAANNPPAIGRIPNQTGDAGGQIGPISFAVADTETPASNLVISGSSSNPSLVPTANIRFTGSGTNRTISVTGASGQAGTTVITISVGDGVNVASTTFVAAFGVAPPAESRLLNLSSRLLCRPNADVLIPGFVISGTASKRLLLRAVGPTLGGSPFNVTGVLPNPRITLKRWTGTTFVDVASNNDWGSNGNVAEIREVSDQLSAFPLMEGGRDAALLVDAAPGQYTVLVNDAANQDGLVLVELYDTEAQSVESTFGNMSTRGFVGTGREVMITGFVVSPEAEKTVLIRAVGPGIAGAPFNVTGTLNDPLIEVHRRNSDGTDTLVASNDDWSAVPEAATTALVAAQVSAFPLADGSLDAALVLTLDPAAYTVVVRGVGSQTGTAVVEVYNVK